MSHLLLLLSFLLLISSSFSQDQPQDYCIPDPGPHNQLQQTHLHTYPCKNPTNLTTQDFIFSNLTTPTTFTSNFSGKSVTSLTFPALHSLHMSFARADFELNGVNPPHFHPRATETALVTEGRVYAGFVDSGGRVFAHVLEKGMVMVFPRGMVHFQMNVGERRASVYGTFDSENPGVVRIPATVFGGGIREGLIERAFGLTKEEVERLRKRFGDS